MTNVNKIATEIKLPSLVNFAHPGYHLAIRVKEVIKSPKWDADLKNYIHHAKEKGVTISTLIHSMMGAAPTLKGTSAVALVEKIYWGHQPSWDWCSGYRDWQYNKLPGCGKPATSHCGKGRGRNARKKESKLRKNARSVGHGVSRYKFRQSHWWKSGESQRKYYEQWLW